MSAVARAKMCVSCDESFTAAHARELACPACRDSRKLRANGQPVNYGHRPAEFIAVDGEGVGRGRDHRYVLLGVGQEQREWPEGVTDITEIFSFLYERYEANPRAAFVGFFLGYDFNMWLRLLPRDRAWTLFNPGGIVTADGRRVRHRLYRCKHARCQGRKSCRLGPFPVQYRGWEFDMLAGKRFKLRPGCEHRAEKGKTRCGCKRKPYMYICDAGSFYQTSLLTAIDPKSWHEPIVSPEEFALVSQGKERRDSALLDDDMRRYNRLENDILARLMHNLDVGQSHAGVHLKKNQWFGPGQSAQTWMRLGNKLDRSAKAFSQLRQPIKDAAIATYYGGWFEIPVHGHIPGTTYEYDINSAYPSVASRLPCLCGKWKSGTGRPAGTLSHKWMTGDTRTPRDRTLRMVRAIVTGKDKHLGPLPYRLETGHIRRPLYTEGWYWQHEIDAARRAGLILDVHYLQWHEYQPCDHEPPLKQLEGLYESRLRIGKNTPEGKAFKLVYNSVYGKLTQSEGEPVFANPVYASLITAGCRVMVLTAIATHPDKSAAVAMVATDGVYFMTPHSDLDSERDAYLKANPQHKDDERLGRWSRSEKRNLTTFKPGVYWDDKARDAISKGEAARFKSRGVSAKAFATQISAVDEIYRTWTPEHPGDWPEVKFTAGFAQVSIVQALQWTESVKDPARQNAKYRAVAGLVQENKKMAQNSNPGGLTGKRHANGAYFDPDWNVYRTPPYKGNPGGPASQPYDKSFGLTGDDADFNQYATPDGPAGMTFRQAIGVG